MLALKLGFNVRVGQIVCFSCHTLLLGQVDAHLETSHKVRISEGQLIAIESIRAKSKGGHKEGDPIQGILLHKGLACVHCDHVALNQSTLATHVSVVHRGKKAEGTPCYFQSLRVGKANTRVNVRPSFQTKKKSGKNNNASSLVSLIIVRGAGT